MPPQTSEEVELNDSLGSNKSCVEATPAPAEGVSKAYLDRGWTLGE